MTGDGEGWTPAWQLQCSQALVSIAILRTFHFIMENSKYCFLGGAKHLKFMGDAKEWLFLALSLEVSDRAFNQTVGAQFQFPEYSILSKACLL